MDRDVRGLAGEIFVVSAAMVGVSLTLMGLIGVLKSLGGVASLADDVLAGASIIFLVACFASYLAVRTVDETRAGRYARTADLAFVIAMIILVAMGAFIAYQLI